MVVDQENAHNQNWNQRTVINRSYGVLFENFIRMLSARNCYGEFIQEASTPTQDISIYEKFWEYQTNGLSSDQISHSEVKERLTALSFVTKRNMDSLMQVVDLIGYGLLLEHKVKHRLIKIESLSAYEKMIRNRAKAKLFHLPPTLGTPKKTKYKNFFEMAVIP